jgi:WD40 repeat protein
VQRGNLKTKNFDIDPNWTSPIQAGNVSWHSDAVNEMHIIETLTKTYFLTAGEDNLIKLLQLNADLSVTTLRTMYQHISAVKCLKICNAIDGHKLLISGGGRSQICVTVLVLGETANYKEECQFMLYSTDGERKRKGVAQEMKFDPETRFMCLDVEELEDDSKKLYVGCSDGFVRMFRLALGASGYEITQTGEYYYGRCSLNLKILRTSDTETVLLTMATDGLVNFYAADQLCSDDCQPFYILKHHDSGINCFECVQVDGDYILATGGDDQRISVTRFRITTSYGFQHVSTKSTTLVHSAQVTGVKFVGGRLVTTSVDQTVAVLDAEELTMERQDYSCIADIKGVSHLKVLDMDYTIVYGSGLEMIENKF